MKAVDTNILLRYVLRDDEVQFIKATAFLSSRTAQNPAFVSLVVLAEFAWALRRRYNFSRAEIRLLVETLLETPEFLFEDEVMLSELVTGAERGDLADHLIAHSARRAGCTSTVTFDKRAATAIPSMEFLA